MTHYYRKSLAELNRDIEMGMIDLKPGDTISALVFGTEGDGGKAEYLIRKNEPADYDDIKIPDGNVCILQPKPKKPKKVKREKRRGLDGTLR